MKASVCRHKGVERAMHSMLASIIRVTHATEKALEGKVSDSDATLLEALRQESVELHRSAHGMLLRLMAGIETDTRP